MQLHLLQEKICNPGMGIMQSTFIPCILKYVMYFIIAFVVTSALFACADETKPAFSPRLSKMRISPECSRTLA